MKSAASGLASPPLRDNSALHAAFGGCGVTLAEARKRAHLDQNDTAATLDMLGQLMMFVGKECLPSPTRDYSRSAADDAKRWPSLSADEQLKTLKRLMGILTTPPDWRDGNDDRFSPDKPMLPLEMGVWEGDECLPSCFGMLVLLASFGRLTQAPMLVASVQRMSAEPVAVGLKSLYGAAYRLIADQLPHAFHCDQLPGQLMRATASIEESVHLMMTRREFHGALVIRLKDGRWVAMDPYMRNMAVHDPQTHPMDSIAPRLLGDRESAATVLGHGVWDEQPRLVREFRTVRQLIQLAQAETLVHSGIPLLRLPEVMRDLLAQHSQLKPFDDGTVLREATLMPGGPELDADDARAIVASAEHSADRHVLRERILLGALRVCTEETWRAARQTRTSSPHHAMMLSAPDRSLAVWALINLRHRLRSKIRAIDLLPYSGSDVTLYNAIVDEQNGRATKKADIEWLAKRKEGFKKAPPYLLHPLVLEVLS